MIIRIGYHYKLNNGIEYTIWFNWNNEYSYGIR